MKTILMAALLAACPAGPALAGDPEPPAPQKVPHMQTLHGETLKDATVTIRDRDSMQQVRVKTSEIERELRQRIKAWQR